MRRSAAFGCGALVLTGSVPRRVGVVGGHEPVNDPALRTDGVQNARCDAGGQFIHAHPVGLLLRFSGRHCRALAVECTES